MVRRGNCVVGVILVADLATRSEPACEKGLCFPCELGMSGDKCATDGEDGLHARRKADDLLVVLLRPSTALCDKARIAICEQAFVR